MCRARVQAAAPRISGSAKAARSTTRLASSGRCCGSAGARRRAPASRARRRALASTSPSSICQATRRASSTAPTSRSSGPTRSSPGVATTAPRQRRCCGRSSGSTYWRLLRYIHNDGPALARSYYCGEGGDALLCFDVGFAVAERRAEMALEGGDHRGGLRVRGAALRYVVADLGELPLQLGEIGGG